MSRIHPAGTLTALLMVLVFFVGCGSVERKVELDKQYTVQPGTKVVVGNVKNQTGQSFDIDVEKLLADALGETLKKRNLQWTGDTAPKLELTAEIVEYKKGDAFKRWIMPGWGSTVLIVRGSVNDAENRRVGSVDVKRSVDAGGGYTVGAWKSIFQDVADDIVTKLEEQLK